MSEAAFRKHAAPQRSTLPSPVARDRAAGSLPRLAAAALVALATGRGALAQGGAVEDLDVERAIAELRAANAALAGQNAALAEKVEALERSARGEDWLSEARAGEIRAIVSDMLADAGDRASLAGDGALAGWDPSRGGFFVESADGRMRLTVMGQVQARWAASLRSDAGLPPDAPETDSWGFEMRRVRVFLGGHVVDPSWTFQFVPAWARGSVPVASATGSLDNAWIRKDFGDGVALRLGQFKPQFMREEQVFSLFMQAVERTTVNEAFSPRWSQGLQLEVGGREDDRFRVDLFYGDAFRAGSSVRPAADGLPAGTFAGSQNTDFNTNLSRYAVTGRVEWLGAGSWRLMRDFDSFRGEGSGWLVGAGGMAQALRPTTERTPDSMWGATADLSVKFDGANLFAAGVYRRLSFADAAAVRDGGVSDGADQFGLVVQGGVFVSPTVELYARYEYGESDMDRYRTTLTALDYGHASIATVGVNWFPAGTRWIQWTTDVGVAFDPVGDFRAPGANWLADPVNAAGAGDANAGQVVVRSQLQLLF
ncbi:MAG: hypothetical protein RIS86_1234 [Planctomycetota bacterium]|jgi:hypothetical protein